VSRFFYDLASPEAWLAAERVNTALPEVPEWVPIRMEDDPGPFRCEQEVLAYREDIERRAAALGLQPVRWPSSLPFDSDWAMLAATYAKQIGRAVAFSLAAFRQAYAGGRDLSVRDAVLIAGAACEMHPAALTKGAELGSIAERLAAATADARATGVRSVPALQVGDAVFHGERGLDEAALASSA
jgi:2-hydroxychromene-2-carboxylate isomerase